MNRIVYNVLKSINILIYAKYGISFAFSIYSVFHTILVI
jgi:hypothetical protein